MPREFVRHRRKRSEMNEPVKVPPTDLASKEVPLPSEFARHQRKLTCPEPIQLRFSSEISPSK